MKNLFAILFLSLIGFSANATLVCFDGTEQASWSVGQLRSAAWDNLTLDASLLECDATGPELNYVLGHFQGLRSRTLPQVDGTRWIYWSGDDALFIVGNL